MENDLLFDMHPPGAIMAYENGAKKCKRASRFSAPKSRGFQYRILAIVSRLGYYCLCKNWVSREEEIDFFLRSKCFVDLYSVVRNGLRASVESYSIKKLEPLYGFTRGTLLSDANMALTKVQACLELGDIEFINEDDRNAVTGYNRDDCISTWRLRDWLETQRANLIAKGVAVPRPDAPKVRQAKLSVTGSKKSTR
jgi:hypothetical protein